MPSKVHTDGKLDELLYLFTQAKDGWSFAANSPDSELIELMQYTQPVDDESDDTEDIGFLFAITHVTVATANGTTEQNIVLFRNDVDGTQSRVQVMDSKGRRVAAFTVHDAS